MQSAYWNGCTGSTRHANPSNLKTHAPVPQANDRDPTNWVLTPIEPPDLVVPLSLNTSARNAGKRLAAGRENRPFRLFD
jgi:hypothetical protein